MTTYLVAKRHHRAGHRLPSASGSAAKAFFLGCLALFTVSSVCCARSPGACPRCWRSASCRALPAAAWCRLSQSILADAFPPAKRPQAFALFGVAVVVAPVVGPTLGGWLSDNWSWHWCFMINAPVGLLAIAMLATTLRDSPRAVAERKRAQGPGPPIRRRRLRPGGDLLRHARGQCSDRGLDDDWFGFVVHHQGGHRLRRGAGAPDPMGAHPPRASWSTCAWWRAASLAPACW